MKTQIKTSGELRSFLLNLMVAVKNGSVKTEELRVINKSADTINESIYSELKAGKLFLEMGRKTEEWGKLPITSSNSE